MNDDARKERRSGLTRRDFGRHMAGLALGLAAFPVREALAEEEAQLVTEIPANEAILGSLQFAEVSAKPDQRCDNCVLYQARGEDRGKCALFQQGLVPAEAWCVSWSPKPA